MKQRVTKPDAVPATPPNPASSQAPPTPKQRARVRITGPSGIRPLTPGEMLQIQRENQPRTWEGDASTVTAPGTSVPCGMCGGQVSTVERSHYAAPFRMHLRCKGLGTPGGRVQAAARSLLDVDLTSADAALIAERVGAWKYRDLPDSAPVYSKGKRPKPWAHVDTRQLRKAISALPTLRARAGRTPHACTAGPCAWCGVRLSLEWKSCGQHWPDGSTAPLCRECAEVWQRYANSPVEQVYADDYSTQRRLGWHALVDTTPMTGSNPAPSGYRLFAEVCGGDLTGHSERGGYIAPDRRPGTLENTLRLARERVEAQARAEARRAAQVETERLTAQQWGYGETT